MKTILESRAPAAKHLLQTNQRINQCALTLSKTHLTFQNITQWKSLCLSETLPLWYMSKYPDKCLKCKKTRCFAMSQFMTHMQLHWHLRLGYVSKYDYIFVCNVFTIFHIYRFVTAILISFGWTHSLHHDICYFESTALRLWVPGYYLRECVPTRILHPHPSAHTLRLLHWSRQGQTETSTTWLTCHCALSIRKSWACVRSAWVTWPGIPWARQIPRPLLSREPLLVQWASCQCSGLDRRCAPSVHGWATASAWGLDFHLRYHKSCWIFALLRRRIVAFGARGTGHEYLLLVSCSWHEPPLEQYTELQV